MGSSLYRLPSQFPDGTRYVLAGRGGLGSPRHQIVPVHHPGAAAKTQERGDISRRAALDLCGVLGVVGNEAAADLGTVGSADDDRVAAREHTVDANDARGQQALA